MCGISGIVNLNGNKVDRELLNKMNDILRHRGPEGEGIYISGNVGLAHRRLKIIDISHQARQPMFNESRNIFITYNGEIYNYVELRKELASLGHRFKSQSDSEVVLHAYEEWGIDCLERFIGMWAFAIWDEQKKILFSSRDRLGVKPFYYFYNEDIFIFASEIKAILEYPGIERYADIQSVYEYLYLGYSLDDKTWIKGINKLNPAHYLILSNGNLSVKRYWQAEVKPDYSLSEEKALSGLNKFLNESVQLMLRADVEVGVHLSGGIDSTSITAVAEQASSQKIRTFSGIFEEGGEFDESRYIKEAVNKYNIVNEKIIIKPDEFIANVKKIIWHMDEPIAGPGAYSQFFVSKLINSCNVKVVLGGQGGDELFGGYPHYYSGILNSIRQLTRLHNNKVWGRYYKEKDFYLKFIPAYLRRCISRFFSLRKNRLNQILNRDILKQINYEDLKEKVGFYKGSFEDMQLWDINNYLPALLQLEDRLSMAFSLETRLPFLNHKLVEFSLDLPFYFKINSFNSKYILRMAMKNELPKSIFERIDKKGFPTPVKIWLKNDKLRQAVSSEIGPDLSRIFTDKEISWERLSIALWLKTFKINL